MSFEHIRIDHYRRRRRKLIDWRGLPSAVLAALGVVAADLIAWLWFQWWVN